MKFLDKVWNALGLVDVEEVDESAAKAPNKQVSTARPPDDVKARRSTVTELRPSSTDMMPKKATPSSVSPANAGNCIIISEPTSFDDAKQIAENVTEQKPVIVNFEKTDAETMKRTVDFMSGITYAVGGTVQRVSGTIFLFAPGRVDVLSGDSLPDEGRGFFQWDKR